MRSQQVKATSCAMLLMIPILSIVGCSGSLQSAEDEEQPAQADTASDPQSGEPTTPEFAAQKQHWHKVPGPMTNFAYGRGTRTPALGPLTAGMSRKQVEAKLGISLTGVDHESIYASDYTVDSKVSKSEAERITRAKLRLAEHPSIVDFFPDSIELVALSFLDDQLYKVVYSKDQQHGNDSFGSVLRQEADDYVKRIEETLKSKYKLVPSNYLLDFVDGSDYQTDMTGLFEGDGVLVCHSRGYWRSAGGSNIRTYQLTYIATGIANSRAKDWGDYYARVRAYNSRQEELKKVREEEVQRKKVLEQQEREKAFRNKL